MLGHEAGDVRQNHLTASGAENSPTRSGVVEGTRQFHYPNIKPENQIRLLQVQNGNRDDTIKCKIEVFDLDKAPT